jgi:nucleotide-binding universal stress UspA family protein
VLVPLDGSALAEQVVRPAADLAGLLGAGCTLLGVEAPDAPAPAEAEARAYLERVAARLRAAGLRVATRVVVARHAAEAILEQASAQKSDLIALATHGRGGLSRVVLGSVADRVLQGASGPVLVYRPAHQD